MKLRPDFRPAEMIKGYHVHIYYDGRTKQWAGHLRREIARLWPKAEIGRWRDKAPQGPHPISHFQVAFTPDLFAELVPWLAMNRKDLDMLVHPNSGDGYEDHVQNRIWIGNSMDLEYEALRRIEAEIKKRKAAAATVTAQLA
jgi:aromatic ring-cleaving dioxygenase